MTKPEKACDIDGAIRVLMDRKADCGLRQVEARMLEDLEKQIVKMWWSMNGPERREALRLIEDRKAVRKAVKCGRTEA